MAYTDDAVKAKLSALNETQESIVTVAQWIMFHRRHAERTASLWLQRLKDANASKRLNLIYLANEVVQQSKARKRDDFLHAFSPIVAEATANAYRGSTSEVQSKVRRVVEVWRQRQIFDQPIQEAIEARINDIDKTRHTGKKPLLGSSHASGPAAPPELQPLLPLHTAVTKAAAAVAAANHAGLGNDYAALVDPGTTPEGQAPPSAPVRAARLSALLKALASAEGAVSAGIAARTELVGALEKLLATHRSTLEHDEKEVGELKVKRDAVEEKKREVEDEILRSLPTGKDEGDDEAFEPADVAPDPWQPGGDSPVDRTVTGSAGGLNGGTNGAGADVPHRPQPQQDGLPGMGAAGAEPTNGQRGSASVEPERPQIEALTPPAAEGLTPARVMESPPPREQHESAFEMAAAGRAYPGDAEDGAPFKRRKVENGMEFGGFMDGDNMASLDADVTELLRSEGGAR